MTGGVSGACRGAPRSLWSSPSSAIRSPLSPPASRFMGLCIFMSFTLLTSLTNPVSACIWNTDLRRQFLPAVMYQRQLGSCFWINRWILPKADINFRFVAGWEPRETVIAQTGLSSVKPPLTCFDLMPAWIWILHPKCVLLSLTTFHTELQMTFPLTQSDRPSLLHISMHHLWGPWKTGGSWCQSQASSCVSNFLCLFITANTAFKEPDLPQAQALCLCIHTEMVSLPCGIACALKPRKC